MGRRAGRVVAFVVVATFSLAGCEVTSGGLLGEPNRDQDTTSTPAPTAEVPTDDRALLAGLEAVVPGITSDPDAALGAARDTCATLRAGSKNVREITAQRFGEGSRLTSKQVDEVIRLVREAPWCDA